MLIDAKRIPGGISRDTDRRDLSDMVVVMSDDKIRTSIQGLVVVRTGYPFDGFCPKGPTQGSEVAPRLIFD